MQHESADNLLVPLYQKMSIWMELLEYIPVVLLAFLMLFKLLEPVVVHVGWELYFAVMLYVSPGGPAWHSGCALLFTLILYSIIQTTPTAVDNINFNISSWRFDRAGLVGNLATPGLWAVYLLFVFRIFNYQLPSFCTRSLSSRDSEFQETSEKPPTRIVTSHCTEGSLQHNLLEGPRQSCAIGVSSNSRQHIQEELEVTRCHLQCRFQGVVGGELNRHE